MNKIKPSGSWSFEEWAREFADRATRDLYAGKSWKRLITLGFSEKLIARGFYLACDFPNSPGYDALAELRDESRRKATQARRLIARLEIDRKELCNLLGIKTASPPPSPSERRQSEPSDPSGLVAHVRAMFPRSAGDTVEQNTEEIHVSKSKPLVGGETLGADAESVLATGTVIPSNGAMMEAFDLAIRKLRILQDEMRSQASKRTAKPTFFLALGITMIKGKAGQPLYRDYANLLNVANQVFGRQELLVGEDAVRKTFQRFMKRNPDAFEFSSAGLVVLAIVLLAQVVFNKSDRSEIGDRTL